jgi:anti-sigma regulatory factor (Ser/Thr protein kinase)
LRAPAVWGSRVKTITLDELAARVSSRMRQDIVQVRQTLAQTVEVMREEVRSGNRVNLPRLITFDSKQPGVDLDSGVAPKSVEGMPPRQPAGELRILLAVPARDFFTSVTAQRLSHDNTKVEVVEGVDGARKALDGSPPSLMVLDGAMEGLARFIRDIKCTRSTSGVAIVVVYTEGVDPKAINEIRVFEDESIVEPFDLDDLVRLTETEIARLADEREFFDHQVRIEMPTVETAIDEANGVVAELLAQTTMPEEAQATLGVAFKEAIDNAARHGNRYQAAKHVKVIYLLDKEKATITIEDDGEGFDTELYLTRGVEGDAVSVARERHQAGRVGGLGIMLMLKCVDNLEYNYAGNMVKLVKKLQGGKKET